MIDRFKDFCVFVCLAIIISGAGLTFYWLVWPFSVVKIYPNGPTEIVKLNGRQFHPGDLVTWNFDVYHHTDGVHVTVTRQIVNDDDGSIIQLAPLAMITTRGRKHATNRSLQIPLMALPGHYHIEMAGVFHVNPLREVVVQRTTEQFQVVAP